jgi:mRNA interferase HigB
MKHQFKSERVVSSKRVVFNIKGNEFLLAVAADCSHGMVLIVWLGTHEEDQM